MNRIEAGDWVVGEWDGHRFEGEVYESSMFLYVGGRVTGVGGRINPDPDVHIHEVRKPPTPEPPLGALVEDGVGNVWRRQLSRGAAWARLTTPGAHYTDWETLMSRHGPLTLLERGERVRP